VTPADPKRKVRGGEQRPLRVRLLGGLLLWVMTLYCGPARRTGRGRGPEGAGLYPELAALGIQEGKSPALVRYVGRLTALLPSYEAVQHELAEHGVPLNIKEVHNIGTYAAAAALTYRWRELQQYRAGLLPAGDGRGKRLGVMIDGGRTKIRTTTRKQKGRGPSKTQKRRYRTDWREPKQFIIFEMDEQGRMKKGTKPILDGTFQGPDELMELLALRLHQAGAAQAEVVAFRSDGAPWIWDRLDWVVRRVGLESKRVSRGLDWCHAVHHIGLALAALVSEAERPRLFKKMRKWLKQGAWQKVTTGLVELWAAAGLGDDAPVWTEISFLARHGRAGHLDYATFRRRRLPVGSGAIESAIRRVINLRMKGNSIFWKEENAEGMLHLRGLVLSRRWTETFAKITASMARDRRLDWKWQSPDLVAQLQAPDKITPPTPQPQVEEATCDAAA
jgi:hypothetical protein